MFFRRCLDEIHRNARKTLIELFFYPSKTVVGIPKVIARPLIRCFLKCAFRFLWFSSSEKIGQGWLRFAAFPTFEPSMEFRIEHDTMGEVKVPADKYWGAQTELF